MSAVDCWFKTGISHPRFHVICVGSYRQVMPRYAATLGAIFSREEIVVGRFLTLINISPHKFFCRTRWLENHGHTRSAARLAWLNRNVVAKLSCDHHITHAQLDQINSTKTAINREREKCLISDRRTLYQNRFDRLHLLQSQSRFQADFLSLVPRSIFFHFSEG